MNSLEYPKLVVLHEAGVGRCNELRKQVVGLSMPFTTLGYTDTTPDKNPHNEGIFEAARGAAFVLIQHELLSPPTVDAKVVLDAALDSPSTRVGVFHEDTNTVQMLDRTTAQRVKKEAIG